MGEGRTTLDMALSSPLPFYACQGPITDPGDYAGLLDSLPRTIQDLCQVLQGLMIHRSFAGYYGLEAPHDGTGDAELRLVRRLLLRMVDLDDRPLSFPRLPEKRLLVVCRDFATMLCSMLRHQGIPARSRCGFARYFGRCPDSTPGFNVDHWVCEVWDSTEARWLLVDAEVDENERSFCHIEIDTLDVPRDQFLVAGKAWQSCRSGGANPDDFGLAPDSLYGLWYIQSQLVRDLAAMNKMELLCWDCWGLGNADPNQDAPAEDVALLDRVAAGTQAGDQAFAELRAIYEQHPQLRVPPTITSYAGGEPRQIDLVSR